MPISSNPSLLPGSRWSAAIPSGLLVLIATLSTAPGAGAQDLPVSPLTSVPAESTWAPLFAGSGDGASGPRDLAHPDPLANFRVVLEYVQSGPASDDVASVLRIGGPFSLPLPVDRSTTRQTLDLIHAQLPGETARITAWHNGKPIAERREVPGRPEDTQFVSSPGDAASTLRFDRNFSVIVAFRNAGEGTLVAHAPATGEWEPDAKALFVRDGRLVYDIGWLGAMATESRVDDGGAHVAAIVLEDGVARLYLDGRLETFRRDFTRPDVAGHVFKVGAAAENFGGRFLGGVIERVRYYERALPEAEVEALTGGNEAAANTPLFEWESPHVLTGGGVTGGPDGIAAAVSLNLADGTRLVSARWQPLGTVDHAAIIRSWNSESLARGETIYRTLCVTCHGTPEQEGSLPTALKFHSGMFRNGADPFRIFQTLTRGYGLMVPQPQYSPSEKYDVVHYIRETFLAPHNPEQLTPVDEAYLDTLPRSVFAAAPPPKDEDPANTRDSTPPYERMDFGPFLMWTYQLDDKPVTDGNFAFKGIAIRLDEGDGGVSKGRAWMLFDHDTMRMAAAWTGPGFVDWKGIAFDGSHGTHTSIAGAPAVALPMGPGWANPADGSWDDPRFEGRDGRKYGPLPREWARYRGLHQLRHRTVLDYEVGGTRILESPEFVEYGTGSIFVRAMEIAPGDRELVLRLAPDDPAITIHIVNGGAVAMRPETAGGFRCLRIPPRREALAVSIFLSRLDAGSLAAIATARGAPEPLGSMVEAMPPVVDNPGAETNAQPGSEDGPFAVDVLTRPELEQNPWSSWMRLSGFDFLPGGDRMAVCTWMGDVWIVEGIDDPLGKLRWTRFASGLFQPLGLKVVEGAIHVTCRDQLARLHDRNGDGVADFIECVNNDHQVTEHFHEFAMGLQTDADGNFYYAKSARHALPALVAHHGTLLRISADGSRTDILAKGFRAANGVCLNPDGTFFVTDQEGHWTPKNRINRVTPGGRFYGNMLGYHDVSDESDRAMEQPLCWITNAFDRSPAELLWVPDSAWGTLGGSLLNLSYGYGRIFVVPHEVVDGQVQGGMCALPIDPLPTGVMRGRFHPGNDALYACGMFAWAGNQQEPGGLYRIRRTDRPAVLPTALHADTRGLHLRFSDPIDRREVGDTARFGVKVWGLKRTANYGSKHLDEHALDVVAAVPDEDGLGVRLVIPGIEPTWCMEIACRLPLPDGSEVERIIHNTIHRLGGSTP